MKQRTLFDFPTLKTPTDSNGLKRSRSPSPSPSSNREPIIIDESRSANIFEGMIFTFVPGGVDLSDKRIDIFSQKIITNHGKVLKLEDLRLIDSKTLPSSLMMICSRNVPMEVNRINPLISLTHHSKS